MEGLEIKIGREHIEPKLLLGGDVSLARIMGQLNLCTCFAGIYNGKNVVACLANELDNGLCDVTDLAVDEEYEDKGLAREMLLYVMNYARSKGLGYLDIGIGNAKLEMHSMLLKTGLRVIGVFPDHFQSGGQRLVVENGIVNRDMIRYRADLNDGWITWTEEVKYRFDQ